jgi:arylsulfatase A-like enzyme
MRSCPLLVLLITAVPGLRLAADPAVSRPNIIVIVSDDQGYADAGFQGSKVIPTPHLDAMAKDGVRCTRGYVTAPVCSPSRAGLMTGRYQQRFGHHNNIVADSANPLAHTPADETLLPQVLAKAGYHTAMVGKWHLGQQDGCRPYERGFQEFFGIITGGHDYFVNNPGERAVGDAQYKARIERNGPVGEKVPGYLTDAFGDDAVRVIRESHAKRPDQPFFLYLAFNAPHTPNQAPVALVDSMPATLEGKQRRTYAAQITSMDAAIGKVRSALKETGDEKDTFIVFFSDNGGAKFPYYDNTPLRATKGTLYEGGIRVPFFATYPARIPAGGVCDLPVTALDVFATACSAAGIKPETTHPLDSKDMLPVLEGKSKQAAHEALFWHFPGAGSAVAHGDLKLVLEKDSKPQLFDLSIDTSEKHDLAEQRPDDVNRLTALLDQWQENNVKPLWGNGSEQAGQDKAPASRDKLFLQRDRDHDGRLSKEEFMAPQKDKAEGEKRFLKFDKDKDGILNREEFVNQVK